MDAIFFINTVVTGEYEKALVYIDPPYYRKGQRLYDNHYSSDDHQEISKKIVNLNEHWVISYDDDPNISEFYRGYRQLQYKLNYSSGKHYKGAELMVYSKNLLLPEPNNPVRK